ncbi:MULTISPECIES: tripartite tricarboxylate transporter permease [unclassified Microbacterium]|uniref:tripartite tricarboxylate transporter permease n=1 Tax=unclassified Microbacterium TaxID=2609290 RepID=UPI0012FCD280|nr:tripartite tricarboxylate transporter permease [Microbacterium sp. MAH-37]MVQ40815.1 tripartite tricarboxylate transporter permease [Microbacterium sp. MAH-37]
MDSWSLLLDGFATAIQPQYLVFAFLGVLIGTAVGVLPGIGPAMTVALLLPLTYTLDPTAALITFAGIYYGGMYGGSTTSILLNTPGESASIVTAIEGNRMAKLGRGAAALATAAIGSFIAGTIATVGLTLLAPVLAQFAVNLGPADYFALIVIAFVTVGALIGSSVSRGMLSLGVGLFLGLIGTDLLSGQQRYTLGLPVLSDGIDIVLVAVGLFAVGETLYIAAKLRHGGVDVIPVTRGWRSWMTREDWKRSWKPWLRGTAIGFPIGTIPAGGADVATFLSYATERKLSKHKQEFGRGAIEGVAGPESANNAAAAGVLVPLLTLGLPTTATAAIILVAFQAYGLQPGPLLFQSQPALVWALVASLYLGNVILIVLNLPLVGMWVKLLQIPRPYLYAGILTFAAFGAYALNFAVADILILVIVGMLGYFMRRYGYPVAPLVVGMILGPMAEESLRKALQLSQGDLTTLIMQPFAAAAYGVLALLVLGGLWLQRRQRRYERQLTETIAVPIHADQEI